MASKMFSRLPLTGGGLPRREATGCEVPQLTVRRKLKVISEGSIRGVMTLLTKILVGGLTSIEQPLTLCSRKACQDAHRDCQPSQPGTGPTGQWCHGAARSCCVGRMHLYRERTAGEWQGSRQNSALTRPSRAKSVQAEGPPLFCLDLQKTHNKCRLRMRNSRWKIVRGGNGVQPN